MDILKYEDVTRDDWDSLVLSISGASRLNSWSWINYIKANEHLSDNLSFIMMQDKKPLSVISLGVSKNTADGHMEMSFGGAYCSTPAIANCKSSKYRKILDRMIAIIFEFSQSYGVKEAILCNPTVNISCINSKSIESEYIFYLQKYGMYCDVKNNFVLNLSKTISELEANISKYHKKHIRRGELNGLSCVVINSEMSPKKIHARIEEYKQLHISVAGRQTRSDLSWEAMASAVINGSASLFIGYWGDTPVSYLFCGEFEQMAYGWSQANVPKHQKDLSPRHFLEWEAAMFYKQRGYAFYEIGPYPFMNSLFSFPTQKDRNIGLFKERYGAKPYPECVWHKFFDKKLFERRMKVAQVAALKVF